MRLTIAFLLLVLWSSLGFADIASGVAQLDGAAAARIAAIGEPPATKPLANESKNLAKARARLALYEGKNNVEALKSLAVAGKFILASGTDDAGVLAGLLALVDGFADGADNRLSSILSAKAALIDPKHVAAVEAASAEAEAFLRKGRASLETNPAKASALLITAYDLLGRVLLKTRNLVTAEFGSPPPAGLTVLQGANSLSLMNAGPAFYDISKIRVFAIVSSNANTVKTYTGEDAKSVVPGLFAVKGSNRIAAGTSFDLMQVVSGIVPAGTQSPRVVGVMQVTLKGEAFFNVFLDIFLP